MSEGIRTARPASGGEPASPGHGSWREFWATPVAMRGYLAVVGLAALVLPIVLRGLGPDQDPQPQWLTVTVLVLISVVNVEISRSLWGGLEHAHQPHKALSAWAFAAALLLPTPWLLAVVPLTYAHARWRGLRLPLWKWVGSAAYLVLAGLAAAVVRHLVLSDQMNWMQGDGRRGIAAMVLTGTAFLAVESVLFTGSAVLNHAEDEVWLRRTLTSSSFYLTESAVLLIGGLLAALWTGGPWYVLFLLPIYALAQRAALHEPLRERAETAAQLAATNRELEEANEFKVELMGMLGHEIGNPLTAIQGYAQLGSEAIDTDDPELVRRSFGVVESNAIQIRTVLHEILATVTSDGGALTARPEVVVLDPHLRAAAAGQRPGRQPVVDCPPDLTVSVQPVHLDQMLANLLSNADKYAGGATSLCARRTADGNVEITVVDEGPGVPPEFEGQLFQRFSRDAEAARRVVGTGLGLFITRQLARANDGDVRYQHGKPIGSVFVVTLPGAATGEDTRADQ